MTTDQVPTARTQIADTTPRRWERLAPAGALVFLLTIILGALAIGESSPDSDGPAHEIAAYFADHQGGHLANTFLVVLGASVFYPWFLASLWRALSRVEGDNGICSTAALVGGITLLGPLLLQATAWGAAALQAGDTATRQSPQPSSTWGTWHSSFFPCRPPCWSRRHPGPAPAHCSHAGWSGPASPWP
jgi:hypothetical protein